VTLRSNVHLQPPLSGDYISLYSTKKKVFFFSRVSVDSCC